LRGGCPSSGGSIFKVAAEDAYTRQPAAGATHNSLTVLAGVALRF